MDFFILFPDAEVDRGSVFARMPELFPPEDLTEQRVLDVLASHAGEVHVPLAMLLRRESTLACLPRDRFSLLVEARDLRGRATREVPATPTPLTALVRNRSDQVVCRVFAEQTGRSVRFVQAITPSAELSDIFCERVLFVAGDGELAPGWSAEEFSLSRELVIIPPDTELLLPRALGQGAPVLPNALFGFDRWLLRRRAGRAAGLISAIAFLFWSFFHRGLLTQEFLYGVVWRRWLVGGLYWKFGHGIWRARVLPFLNWPLRKLFWFLQYQLRTRFGKMERR